MMEQQAKDYLAETAARLKRQGINHVEEWIPHGNPADEIISLAQSTPNNLVAMTSHGRSGLQRWVLGSVADGVVRNSGDPVLLVKAAE